MWCILNVTNRCNIACQHCIRGKATAEDLDVSLMPLIMRELRSVRCLGISITGGEPITHPQFPELLEGIKKANWRINITTNALKTAEYMELLKDYKHRCMHLVLSLDSHEPGLNDELRGKGTYAAVMESIKALWHDGHRVKISHSINNRNYKDVRKFLKFMIEDTGINRVHLTTLIATPGNKHLLLTKEQRAELHQELEQLHIRYGEHIVIMSTVGFKRPLTFCQNIAAPRDISIDYNANLVFCCDNPGAGYPVGSLKERSLLDLMADYIDMQNKVKKARFVEVAKGNWDYSNDCDFCNRITGGLCQ